MFTEIKFICTSCVQEQSISVCESIYINGYVCMGAKRMDYNSVGDIFFCFLFCGDGGGQNFPRVTKISRQPNVTKIFLSG